MTPSVEEKALSPHCPACGRTAPLEPAFPEGEATCARCAPLLVLLRDQYGPQIRLKMAFIEDLGADSLEVAESLMHLEDKLGVALPDDQANKIHTVGDAV